jgi:hypothetical protein
MSGVVRSSDLCTVCHARVAGRSRYRHDPLRCGVVGRASGGTRSLRSASALVCSYGERVVTAWSRSPGHGLRIAATREVAIVQRARRARLGTRADHVVRLACGAHNPKVVGSNPTPATIENPDETGLSALLRVPFRVLRGSTASKDFRPKHSWSIGCLHTRAQRRVHSCTRTPSGAWTLLAYAAERRSLLQIAR